MQLALPLPEPRQRPRRIDPVRRKLENRETRIRLLASDPARAGTVDLLRRGGWLSSLALIGTDGPALRVWLDKAARAGMVRRETYFCHAFGYRTRWVAARTF